MRRAALLAMLIPRLPLLLILDTAHSIGESAGWVWADARWSCRRTINQFRDEWHGGF